MSVGVVVVRLQRGHVVVEVVADAGWGNWTSLPGAERAPRFPPEAWSTCCWLCTRGSISSRAAAVAAVELGFCTPGSGEMNRYRGGLARLQLRRDPDVEKNAMTARGMT